MKRPKLLDLYCCQGGAAMGYHRAGFDITGIDNIKQPKYPFNFILGEAIPYLINNWYKFNAIHASPPCQIYTWAGKRWNKPHIDMLTPTLLILSYLNIPWIVENVPGAPLSPDIMLNGKMFNLKVIRNRYFWSNILLFNPISPPNKGTVRNGDYFTVVGHGGNGGTKFKDWCNAMDITWMNKYGLTQSIPPAYTEFIGNQLITFLTNKTN